MPENCCVPLCCKTGYRIDSNGRKVTFNNLLKNRKKLKVCTSDLPNSPIDNICRISHFSTNLRFDWWNFEGIFRESSLFILSERRYRLFACFAIRLQSNDNRRWLIRRVAFRRGYVCWPASLATRYSRLNWIEPYFIARIALIKHRLRDTNTRELHRFSVGQTT